MSTISFVATAETFSAEGSSVLDAAGMLLDHFAGRGASHVHGDVAAADHDYFLADGELVAEIHVEQKVDALVDAVEIDAGNGEIAAAMRANRDQHGIETLPAQIGNREVAAGRVIQLERDVAGLENLADLRLYHVARQAVFRNSQIEHSTRDRSGFEDRDRVAHQGKIVCGRKSHRAAADDGNFVRKFLLPAPFVDVDGMLRLGSVLLGQKSLQRANRDGLVDLAAPAGSLTRMRAHASADAGQRIGFARQAIGLFETTLGDQADVAPGVGVGRTRHHAGEVGVQPVPVDLLVFESFQHCGTFSLSSG